MNMCCADWNLIENEIRYLRFFHEAIRDYLGPADGDCIVEVQSEFVRQGGTLPSKWKEGD